MACTFDVKLKPKAKKNSVSITNENVLDVSVTSPPIDNKANNHLIRLLSDTLRVPKSSIEIIKGGHSKSKSVAIDSLTREEVIAKLT